jgi:hypothetical protein
MSEVGVVRRRRSRSEAAALVEEYEASGLSREGFCRQRGLVVGTLDKYRRLVRDGLRSVAGRMIPVEVAPSPRRETSGDVDEESPFVVRLHGGRRIEVRRGFDAGTLERLLAVLDGA